MKREFFRYMIDDRVCSYLYIFQTTRRDRGTNVGQIETAIIRHWLFPRRGSGVFLIPPRPGSGGDELDVKLAGDADDLLRRGGIHTYRYFVNSIERAAAQVIDRSPPSSYDRLLSRAIFFPFVFLEAARLPLRVIDCRLALRSLVRHVEYR